MFTAYLLRTIDERQGLEGGSWVKRPHFQSPNMSSYLQILSESRAQRAICVIVGRDLENQKRRRAGDSKGAEVVSCGKVPGHETQFQREADKLLMTESEVHQCRHTHSLTHKDTHAKTCTGSNTKNPMKYIKKYLSNNGII